MSIKLKEARTLLLDTNNLCDECDWEFFLIELGTLVSQRFTTGYVLCEAENMGWRHLSGYKVFECDLNDTLEDLGRSFLNAFCPDCDWSARVYSYKNDTGLYLNVTHHDNPVSGDDYYLTPIDEETYDKMS